MLTQPTVGKANKSYIERILLARPTVDFGTGMIRFRINELLEECSGPVRLHMQDLADAIGVPRSTLAGLTTRNREPVTNTATLEALFRYFQNHHPGFETGMLFEFDPPLAETVEYRVDELYPQRAEKSRRSRRLD